MKSNTLQSKLTHLNMFTWFILFLTMVFAPMAAFAANVSMTASDASGASSLTSAGKWSNAAAPSAANDYFTSTFFIRTPQDSGGITTTFAGNSLTLQAPSGQSAPMRSIIYKGGASDTIIINNLTNAAGGVLNNGGSGNVAAPTFTGNLWTIAGNSTILSDQGSTIIGYPLAGSAILTNSSGQARTITYTGNLSGFTGKFYIFNSVTVVLDAGSSNLGNPAGSTLDQITIGNGCTLLDNAGLTFNNANGGITLLGGGSATINAAGTTTISEPITDVTNGVSSVSALIKAGAGTLVLSSANNTWSGGTTISAGTLQIGVANALPGGNLTDNGTLDLNTFSAKIGALNGAGGAYVDTVAGGTPTLTVGTNDGSGTYGGVIQNSAGTLSLIKLGAGTQTLTGGYTYSGQTLVAGGTLNLNTLGSVPSTPGNLIVSNGAVLNADASIGIPLPANNLVVGTNSSLGLTLNNAANGVNATGNLTLQDNATNNFAYGTITANPTAPAINVTGGISAPGSNIVINIAATGLKTGTFTLIKYTGTPLANIANFQVNPPPGVAATLVNNTGNDSIDLNITSTPNQLAWNGVNGTSWDLATANWTNLISGGITAFQQYTNGSVIAGDSVLFDDTLTNDFVNPQPTNIVLNSQFYAFPVVFNSSLPYRISGTGGILGVTSLVVSNTGSVTLLTSNKFTGGVTLAGGSLIITNDSALGAGSGSITLNGGALQMNGGVTNSRLVNMPVAATIGVGSGATARFAGVINGAGALNKTDVGTLVLATNETFTGNVFAHAGTLVLDAGGKINNGGNYSSIGQSGTDNAILTLKGTATFTNTGDFNLGDLDSSSGTLNIQDTAALTVNQFFIGSANAGGSTASGTVNQTGGTIVESSTAIGAFAIGGRTSASGVGTYNMSGGTLTANSGIRVGGTGVGTLNQSGGTINALGGINIARIAGSFGTNNLNGGTLSTLNVGSSTGINAVFNFNGGTLQAAFSPPSAWMSGGIQANILAGGAVIDSSNYNVTISTPLLAGSASGGLTKKGLGTLTLTGVNTFTGPITNTAGTLSLNSVSTYAGSVAVNAGTLQLTTASTIQGTTMVSNNATFSIVQQGSGTASLGNLTFNGAASGAGGVVALALSTANNPAVPFVNCGTLTLNGTNTIGLAAVNVGTIALVKYTGALAGSGNITNLTLPQGATGFISNNAANSTLYAVITSTGPGLVWAGTNSNPALTNLWDINSTTNWLLGATPTSYHQIVVPGDAVTFNDSGSGTVVLSNSVGPASMTISNNAKSYTFNGPGSITGPSGLLKLGSGTATLNFTNNSYTGNTTVSNGTLVVATGVAGSAMSSAADLVVGSSGTLQLSSQQANVSTTVKEFSGSGVVHYTGGNNSILAFGGSSGVTWNGTIYDNGGGGLALTKSGSGTWVVGGNNYLNNGDAFNAISQNQFNGGTTVITNGGLLSVAFTECWIAQGAGSTGAVVVAGGTLAVSNNWISVGRGDATANGTLIVNSGSIVKAGANNIVVGSVGATGSLIINGGQVLDNNELWLGDGATANASLYLNGGLLQLTDIRPNGTPVNYTAYFNGGTLRANTNSANFLQVISMVMSNGLVLDDNGFTVSIGGTTLQSGDAFNGGLVKKGAGAVYLDAANSYTGTTLVTNGLLAGVGSVAGPVTVASTGNLGAGDEAAIGTLTINNNLTLQGAATLRINRDVPASDLVAVTGNASYGGTLVVSNLSVTPLTTSDTFNLFSVSGSKSGNFSNIVGSPGTGLSYSFNPANGVLSVVSIASNPTNITYSVSGNILSLSWPADHLGWILQVQTNNLSVGLNTNWVDVAGSASVTQTNVNISAQTPSAFYRLRKP